MACRFTKEEKGKHQLADTNEPIIKRINAPYVDTAALIKENDLTLIGREEQLGQILVMAVSSSDLKKKKTFREFWTTDLTILHTGWSSSNAGNRSSLPPSPRKSPFGSVSKGYRSTSGTRI
ncbi:hypothetical protein Bca52824_074364 [Brassica carinata]|uniref:Uncharacterized protein n=1 Tax=Brassica carinata TaxID=52824 RepID=A0A8X7PPW3_BRACI|nr:hypothetical protein Bca52824_074364 [Brassica carinata]